MQRINHFPTDLISREFSVHIAGQEIPVTVTPHITPEECETMSRFYQGMHHENMRLPAHQMAYHVVHVVAAWAPVRLHVCEPIRSFTLHPLRKKIQATRSEHDDSVLHFSLPDNVPYLLVQINKLPLLCFLHEPVIPEAQGDCVDFRQYVSAEDHSEAFQKAFHDINQTGRTLYVPPGNYVTSPLRLHKLRHCHIHFAANALINIAIDPPGTNLRSGAGLWLDECEDVSISGSGCIDQRSYENFQMGRNDYSAGLRTNEYWQSLQPVTPDDPLMQSPLFITNSNRITIRDVTLRNGKVWNINVKNSSHLHFERCKVIAPPASNPEWLDGFNLGGCRDVQIQDCLMLCNDDPFAGAHHLSPYLGDGDGDIRVFGLVGYNPRANGIRLGWACRSDQGSYYFENCDFIGNCEILVHKLPLAMRYESIRFRDCGFDGSFGITVEGVETLEFSNVAFNGAFLTPPSIRDTERVLIQNTTVNGVPLPQFFDGKR